MNLFPSLFTYFCGPFVLMYLCDLTLNSVHLKILGNLINFCTLQIITLNGCNIKFCHVQPTAELFSPSILFPRQQSPVFVTLQCRYGQKLGQFQVDTSQNMSLLLDLGKDNFQAACTRAYTIYRVSRKTLLLISRPPKHVEVPSWTFFNSPFRVDFKAIKFPIIW